MKLKKTTIFNTFWWSKNEAACTPIDLRLKRDYDRKSNLTNMKLKIYNVGSTPQKRHNDSMYKTLSKKKLCWPEKMPRVFLDDKFLKIFDLEIKSRCNFEQLLEGRIFHFDSFVFLGLWVKRPKLLSTKHISLTTERRLHKSHKNAPKAVNWSERSVVRVRLESHTFSNQQVRKNKGFPKTKSMRGILSKAQYAFFVLPWMSSYLPHPVVSVGFLGHVKPRREASENWGFTLGFIPPWFQGEVIWHTR